jgi:hypothetical protein
MRTIEKITSIQDQVLSSVTVMHRMFRNLCADSGTGTAASERVFLVHQSSVVLSDAAGEPLWFESADAAAEFARHYLCEPLAYETRSTGDRSAAAPRPAPPTAGVDVIVAAIA